MKNIRVSVLTYGIVILIESQEYWYLRLSQLALMMTMNYCIAKLAFRAFCL